MKRMSPAEVAADELKNSIGLLIRRLRGLSPNGLEELSWTQKSVIARLFKDGPATTAELARLEGVKPQSMGTALSELLKLSLIERKAHPSDRRQYNIALTPKGSEMRKSYKDASRSWLADQITKLNKQEQATLFKAGEIIKHMVEL